MVVSKFYSFYKAFVIRLNDSVNMCVLCQIFANFLQIFFPCW